MVVRFLDDLQADSFEVKSDRYRNGKMVIEMEQNPRRMEKLGATVCVPGLRMPDVQRDKRSSRWR